MPTYLVGCGKAKLPGKHRAADLYTGSLFRLARAYAERSGTWYILSAQHGIVLPTAPLDSYDRCMADLSPAQVTAWRGLVAAQLHDIPALATATPPWVVLAGEDYCAALRAYPSGFPAFQEPLKGLRLGERMAWLKAHMPPLPSAGRQRNLL